MINGGCSFEAPNSTSWRCCSIAAAQIPFGSPPTEVTAPLRVLKRSMRWAVPTWKS